MSEPDTSSSIAGAQERLDRRFRRESRFYDLQLPLERRALRVAVRLAAPRAGERVVDVAAGTGALSARLLEAADGRLDLLAVDRLPAMLGRARRRLRPWPKARLLLADAACLPVEDGAVDLVTMGYLLHLLPPERVRAVLLEARRVMAPAGRLVTVTHTAPWADVRLEVEAAGLRVRAARRVPGVYWSQVLVASLGDPWPPS
jgi:ubiquinone/menaquinone biosynthesis C-methylase UbiE